MLTDIICYASFQKNFFDVNAGIQEASGDMTNVALNGTGFLFDVAVNGIIFRTNQYDLFQPMAPGDIVTITLKSAPPGTRPISPVTAVGQSITKTMPYVWTDVHFLFTRQ